MNDVVMQSRSDPPLVTPTAADASVSDWTPACKGGKQTDWEER